MATRPNLPSENQAETVYDRPIGVLIIVVGENNGRHQNRLCGPTNSGCRRGYKDCHADLTD
jgi:hypothetical protein